MKYVIFRDETFVIFPDSVEHSSFDRFGDNNKPISAGFCIIESRRNDFDDIVYKVGCYGKSYSLNLESRGSIDSDIISKQLRIVY